MSYLTAPDDAALARPRIERALASSVPIDRDLQEFMKGDLREILAQQPLQKPAILAAYKAASPQNQAIFEALAAEIDPDFAQSVRERGAEMRQHPSPPPRRQRGSPGNRPGAPSRPASPLLQSKRSK